MSLTSRHARLRPRLFVACLCVAGVLAPDAAARTDAAQPKGVWGIELTAAQGAKTTPASLAALRSNGINAIVVRGAVSKRRLARLRSTARSQNVALIRALPASANRSRWRVQRACASARAIGFSTCATSARSVAEAAALARRPLTAAVVVRVRRPSDLVAIARRKPASRVIAIVPVTTSTVRDASWAAAIRVARASARLDLVVAPRSSAARDGYLALLSGRPVTLTPLSPPRGLRVTSRTPTTVTVGWQRVVAATRYAVYRGGTLVGRTESTRRVIRGLACGRAYRIQVEALGASGARSVNAAPKVVRASIEAATTTCASTGGAGGGSGGSGGGGGGAADSGAPTAPASAGVSSRTSASLHLSWAAATDDVAVTGYGVYRAGSLVGSSTGTAYVLAGLVCGTTYALAVDAFDAAGNRSPKSSFSGYTAACTAAGDTEPPSVPQGMAFAGISETTVSLSWQPSTDDVGVARYVLYRNGVQAGTTTGLAYTFGGLACGTSYTFALEAHDAAGNASNRSQATGTTSTAACPSPPPPPPDGGGAAALFVAPGGSDAASCSQASPCASFQRAYALAAPGATVEVAGGTYAGQTVTSVAGKSAPSVLFRPAAGARVILGGLTFGSGGEAGQGPDYITVRGMEMTYKGSGPGARNQRGIFVGPGSSHIRLEHMDAGNVHTWFADNVFVLGGDYGPCDAVWGSSNVCGNSKFDVSTNVTVDGALFHDYRFDSTCFTVSGADCHWECMYVNAGENITIRNSTFRDCAIFDIFTTISGPDAGRVGHRNLVIENNWFDTPWTESLSGGSRARPTAVSLAWCQNSSHGYRNVLVRFNSFQRNTGLELDRNSSCVWENVRVVANLLMYQGTCDSRINYAYNVWSTAIRTGTCGATDRVYGDAFPYANSSHGAAMDFHLGVASFVDDLVPASAAPDGCPATDIDGNARSGGTCDAGADER